MEGKIYYVVKGIEKKISRDSKGRFLPKKKKYISITCPKVGWTHDLHKAKLFNSVSKANYALWGINAISEKRYDFNITEVKSVIEEK